MFTIVTTLVAVGVFPVVTVLIATTAASAMGDATILGHCIYRCGFGVSRLLQLRRKPTPPSI